MEPDKYQQAWQTLPSQTRVTIDADLLLKEVRRNQRDFRALIFRRNFFEVTVGVLLIPLWFYLGAWFTLPWTWYLTVPALLWVTGFFLADRIRNKQKSSEPGEPLLKTVEESLSQVEHQIWLLRNVFWWYLLPPTISIEAFFAHVTWLRSKNWLEVLANGSICFSVLVTYSLLDYINQRAVRLQLEPRRQELLALLASLGGDDATAESATTKGAERVASSNLLRRWVVVTLFCLVILAAMAWAKGIPHSNHDPRPRSSGPRGDSLARLVTDLRKRNNLVGLAAMVMVDGQVEAAAAYGERKIGSGVSLEISDRWHLGGVTRSITATMIARLVESGQMQWTDTIGKVFPDPSVHDDWKPVTLRQLLTDTAGAPTYFPKDVLLKRPALGLECTEARREAVLGMIAKRPACRPGKRRVYSTVGYTIAGAMAEKVTGVTWEDLTKREVFEPLKLTEAGFGPPKSSDKTLEQPRGHLEFPGGKVWVDDKVDNTPITAPSGIVHMSLRDLCTFATEHLRGDLGKGRLLSADSYKQLHTPQFHQYACGWVKREPDGEIPHTVYWNNGSNTMWYALVVFIPDKNTVIAVTSNDGDLNRAEAAAWEIVKASANEFNVKDDSKRHKSAPANR